MTVPGLSNQALFTGAFLNDYEASGQSVEAASKVSYNLAKGKFNATNSNAVYGTSSAVQPPALIAQYLIRY